MRTIDLSIVETLIREALPRATEEEIGQLVSRFGGRAFHPDNNDLLTPFGPRDTARTKLARVQTLIGCAMTGRRNGWALGDVSRTVERLVEDAAARAA